jgi:hypothetical protein
MQNFLISQSVIQEQNYLSIFSIFFTIFVGKYFILDLGLKEIGFAYCKILQECCIFLFLLILMAFKSHKETLVPPTYSLVKEDFGVFVKKSAYSLLAIYGEFLAWDGNTYLAA